MSERLVPEEEPQIIKEEELAGRWVKAWSGDDQHGAWIRVFKGLGPKPSLEEAPPVEELPEAGTLW